MEIVTRDPFSVMTKIKNAGAIFIGEYSSEPLGDYFAGTKPCSAYKRNSKILLTLSVDELYQKVKHYLIFKTST